MKLYLSSYKFGNDIEKLSQMASKDSTFAYIANAIDQFPDSPRKDITFNETKEVFAKLGFNLERLDLRNYFDSSNELRKKMTAFNGAWVIGGNAFVLRRAMEYSGFDDWLNSKKDSDFVYGGFSAGICVLAKDLRGLELMDNPDVVPTGYNSEIIWEGVGLLDYLIIPHYNSPEHPETEAAKKTVEHFENNHLPFKAISDGQVLIQTIARKNHKLVLKKSDITH